MNSIVYDIPVHLIPAYRGRKVLVRSHDATELRRALPAKHLGDVVGVRLLSVVAYADALADWGYGVPVELLMERPEAEFPLLYRHARLLDKHPVRVLVHLAPGVGKALKVAASLQFAVKLSLGQPTTTEVEELREVLNFYLRHPSVTQPVEPFHSMLMAAYHDLPVTLWDIQEEDPVVIRRVTDDGYEVSARRGADPRDAVNLDSFVSDLQAELLGAGAECHGCEFFARCGGYFKWPRRDYSCEGVKSMFRTISEAAAEVGRDLAGFEPATAEVTR